MLEKLDKKILYSLDEDSSKSLTKISQEVGSTPQLVKYHLKKIEKDGLILHYFPMIEFRKLGFSNVSYFLKLKNITKKTEGKIINYLSKKNNFNIIMRGDGYWDLHITISAKNVFRAVEVFNNFYDKFHNYILHAETAISVGFFQFRRSYLSPSPGAKTNHQYMALTGADVEPVKLNNYQVKIIEELNKNCRQSFADLAKKLKISRDMAVYHLNKLQKENIIQSNSFILNHDKTGYPRYRLLLQLTDFTSEKYKTFFDYCQRQSNIVHLLRLFGNWQALMDIEIESREKLRSLLRNLMNKFSGFVLRIEITHVYKIDKFRDIPFDIS
ncbi:hypothetical protein COV49_01005 [Candidatus Falkowbacteria bacterium CG11_big_fil_rev_8_21_14_0_20_39_10]|uniref:HTH asnC-type domain-containing protein n=1 Tax=Candidatus Falkowbacteria bacterium CG11_big_fil_rev_8_21_14_0_20_39_10 TaxID=1974570 RepID=A0A2M6K9V9_9BACT|nr:MAG: hypothetical protein COV49_01005 [Candidatus Falkowbacteria bacterium CG11_big_fil_rev_8_21_14_0_20_39_10]